jgi:putative oxidoreductase
MGDARASGTRLTGYGTTDTIMRFLTRSGSLAAVNAGGPHWIVPIRLAVGVLLLCPIDGSIQQLFTFYHADKPAFSFGVVAAGTILRAIEILAGLSFVAGLGTRLAGYPTVALFAVRAVANFANSFTWVRDIVSTVIVPHGDWGYGAMYLAVALLLGELLGNGSGPWSVDHWLSKRFGVVGKSDPGR